MGLLLVLGLCFVRFMKFFWPFMCLEGLSLLLGLLDRLWCKVTPLSGLLFILVMNPFFEFCKREVDDKGGGLVRGCADDVGASLSSVWGLVPLQYGFGLLASGGNLHLEPST